MEQSVEPQWFIASVRASDIDKVLTGLEQKAIHAIYPQAKDCNGMFPVLPGYAFVFCEPHDDEFAKITEQRGVLKLLPVSHTPSKVPMREMDEFLRRLGTGEFDEKVEPVQQPLPWFSKNEKIGVTSGPFTGHTAVFKRVHKGEVVADVTFFGRTLEVRLKGHQVRKLS